jgi:hypothetical protein
MTAALSFRPEHLWYPNALIVGEDRVAVDQTAWQMIERKRAEAGPADARGSGPSAALHCHRRRRHSQVGRQRSAAHHLMEVNCSNFDREESMAGETEQHPTRSESQRRV